ncbi:MAG: hypothetical protein QGG64_15205 [Candidatus Latescibacteria bacterium]|nr:hypothetical protein [Candidatus Latescibacterota bacterium]
MLLASNNKSTSKSQNIVIYAYLAQLLNVEYDHAQIEIAEETPISDNWQNIVLPKSLYTSIVTAVETHSVTDLRKYMDILEDMGPEAQNLAKQFRQFARQFDMESIKTILEQLDSGSEPL